MSAERDPISYRPELPDWGIYPRWPTKGEGWIHPQDIALVQRLIPSMRVFRRSRWDGTYYWLNYGKHVVRVAPTMWLRVPQTIDLEIGQAVEVLSRDGKNDPGIFRIADILFDSERQEIGYYLYRDQLRIDRRFERDDLKPLEVHHNLRVGYYQHLPQKSALPDDLDRLDVGDLLE